MIAVSENIEKTPRVWEAVFPSRARLRRMQKVENLLLYYGVDLALEKSNPLTYHKQMPR